MMSAAGKVATNGNKILHVEAAWSANGAKKGEGRTLSHVLTNCTCMLRRIPAFGCAIGPDTGHPLDDVCHALSTQEPSIHEPLEVAACLAFQDHCVRGAGKADCDVEEPLPSPIAYFVALRDADRHVLDAGT